VSLSLCAQDLNMKLRFKEITKREFFVYLAIFLSVLSFISIIITRNLWLLIILIPSTIFIRQQKAKSKEEEIIRERATIASYSIIVLLPVAIIMVLVCYILIVNVLPGIIESL
jgi:hypothetical protein